jgi:hypothetical protein
MVNCNCNTNKQSKNKQLKKENMSNTNNNDKPKQIEGFASKSNNEGLTIFAITFCSVLLFVLIFGAIYSAHNNSPETPPIVIK